MTTDHRIIPGRLIALLIATALLAGGLLTARADAAPVGAVAGATAPVASVVAPPVSDEFVMTQLSRTSVRLVGQGRYAGISVDVQVLTGTTASLGFLDGIKKLWDTVKGGSGGTKIDCTGSAANGATFPTSGDHNTVNITINVTVNNCSPS
jgi:hypothetical protein